MHTYMTWSGIHNVECMYRLLKDRNVPKKAKQIIHQTILRP